MPQTGLIVLRVIFSLVGLICIVFSYLIGVKGKTTLIAGYCPEKVKDEKGLSRFIGLCTFIIGLYTILFPLVYGPDRAKPLIWILYFCVPVIVMALVMIIGSPRYEDKSVKQAKD